MHGQITYYTHSLGPIDRTLHGSLPDSHTRDSFVFNGAAHFRHPWESSCPCLAALLLCDAYVEAFTNLCVCCSSLHAQSWNQEGTGFNISKDEQILYNKWFVELVSARQQRTVESQTVATTANNVFSVWLLVLVGTS